jgi:hypothetical protein
MSDLMTALRLIISGDSVGAVAAIEEVTAATDKGTAAAERENAAWASTAKTAHSGMMLMAAGAGLVVGGLALMGEQYKKYMSAVVQAEQMTGMHAKAASQFTGELQAMGGSVDQVGRQLKAYDKTYTDLTDSTRKASAAQTEALNDMGLTAAQLKAAGPEKALFLMRDALSQIPDAAKRATDAATVFGGRIATNPAFERWINAAPGQIQAVNAELAKSGKIVTDQQVDMAKKLGVAWEQLKTAFQGIEIQGFSALAPVILAVTRPLGLALQLFMQLTKWTHGLLPDVMLLTTGLGLMAVGFAKVYTSVTTLVKGGMSLIDALKVMRTGKIADTIATEAETVAVGEETVAVEAETVATGSNTMAMLASLGPYALVAAAIAVDIVLIGKAVKAYEEMQQAIQQAAEAAKNAQSTLNAAPNSAFQTNNPNMQSNQSRSQIQSEINRDKYKSPGWEVWKWFGGGGSFTATKPTVIGVGEGGVAEDVTITPHGGSASPSVTEGAQAGGAKGGRGGVVLQFPGAVFYGEPSPAIAQRWAKALAQPLGEMLYNTKHGAGH